MDENQIFCQSCCMPLTEEEHFGTNADGTKSEDYCSYCFKNGSFTSDESMEQMIETCIPMCVQEGVYPNAEAAREDMLKYFPTLKRWKKEA